MTIKDFYRNFIQYINKRIFQKYSIKLRKKKYNIKNLSIISSDCTGGCILHDYGLPLDTPTVNLIIEGNDFIKFCRNLDYYLDKPLICCKSKETYPVVMCGDVLIKGLHYKSFEELRNTWDRRKKRIHNDNLVYIMTERQLKNNENFIDFMNLGNSCLFLASKDFKEENNNCKKIKNFDKMFLFKGLSGKRNLDYEFDFGEWYVKEKNKL